MRERIFLGIFILVLLIALFVLFNGEQEPQRNVAAKSKGSTPLPYRTAFKVSSQRYATDSASVVAAVDSLIGVGVLNKARQKTRTYFNGQFYEDSVERDWAIDLPIKDILYLNHYVDTIVYHRDDSTLFAGLMISRCRRAPNALKDEFLGYGFVCRSVGGKHLLRIVGPRSAGRESRFESSKHLRKLYFHGYGEAEEWYNLDDIRYWTMKEMEEFKRNH